MTSIVSGCRALMAATIVVLAPAWLWAQQLTPWSVAGNMASSRSFGTATALNDGRVLLTGGASDPSFPFQVVATVDLYDPAAGTVTAGPPMSEAKYAHIAVKLTDGRVLVAGGLDANSDLLTSAEIFDPATNTWSAASNLPGDGRGLAHAALLSDGRVLVAGGLSESGYSISVDIFDPADGPLGSWTAAAPMAAAHYLGSATRLADGRVLIAYGQTDDFASNGGSPYLQTAEVYNPVTNSWSPTGMPNFAAGYLGSLITLADGRAAFISAIEDLADAATYGTGLDIYSPSTNTWSPGSPVPSPTVLLSAGVLSDGRVVVAGGYDLAGGIESAATKLWDPVAGTWSAAPPLNQPHAGTPAVVLPSGQVVVVGSYTYQALFIEVTHVNHAPLANAGGAVSGSTCDSCINAVLVNAGGSSDPDGDALTFVWKYGSTTLLTTTDAATAVQVPAGATLLTLVVRDPYGAESTDTLSVTLVNVEDGWRAIVSGLQSQVQALDSQVQGLLADLAICQAGGGGSGAALTDLSAYLSAAFGDPGFTIPGATPDAQLANLIDALKSLNHGQQLAIYTGLGGKAGKKN